MAVAAATATATALLLADRLLQLCLLSMLRSGLAWFSSVDRVGLGKMTPAQTQPVLQVAVYARDRHCEPLVGCQLTCMPWSWQLHVAVQCKDRGTANASWSHWQCTKEPAWHTRLQDDSMRCLPYAHPLNTLCPARQGNCSQCSHIALPPNHGGTVHVHAGQHQSCFHDCGLGTTTTTLAQT